MTAKTLRMCSMHEQLQGEPNPNCPACRGEVSEHGR